MKKNLTLNDNGVLKGCYSPPGDKSISHRAIMLSALADGESRISNFLESADCLHTLKAFQELGVSIDLEEGSGTVSVKGSGMRSLKVEMPGKVIDLGNSGTSMRLMLGILAGQKLEVTLAGDDSLSSRPMKRVTTPLKKMGAQIKGNDNANFAPLTIRGGKLKGIDYENKLGSAQVKSAILLAGLFAEGETVIRDVLPSRDHTERMLKGCDANFSQVGNILTIKRTEQLKPLNVIVPGDISSAAFFVVGAAMIPGSELTIENVGLNSTRTGVLEVLKRMGAHIEVEVKLEDPEPIGRIHVEGRRLSGTRIVKQEIPSLIDELPVLMIAMALAEGESLVSGAEELRVKETDRIHSMVDNLKAIGGDAEELPDGCLIRGVERFRGGEVKSFGDHRTAMSFAIASLCSDGPITLHEVDCVMTSFPSFFDHFQTLKSAAR